MISDLQYFFSFQIKKQIHLIFFIECAQASPPAELPTPAGLLHPSSALVAALAACGATATMLREGWDPIWHHPTAETS